MNNQIYCPVSTCGCDHPERCQQVCEATLTTGNGGNTVTKGKPMPRRQFQPDYGIEHTKVSYVPTPLAWCIGIFAVVMWVVYLIRTA